jgi:hypothetical protein
MKYAINNNLGLRAVQKLYRKSALQKIQIPDGCIWKIYVPAMFSMNTLFTKGISPPETSDGIKTKTKKQMFLKQHEEANA